MYMKLLLTTNFEQPTFHLEGIDIKMLGMIEPSIVCWNINVAEISKCIEKFCKSLRLRYISQGKLLYMSVWCSLSETKIILWEFMFTFIYMHNFSERKKIRLIPASMELCTTNWGLRSWKQKKKRFLFHFFPFSWILNYEDMSSILKTLQFNLKREPQQRRILNNKGLEGYRLIYSTSSLLQESRSHKVPSSQLPESTCPSVSMQRQNGILLRTKIKSLEMIESHYK